MTVPNKFSDTYIPLKYFLSSYRALSDGKSGVRHLEEHLESSRFILSDWKVIWVGVCTLLRTSVELFRVDAESCIDPKVREEMRREWNLIKEDKEQHPIFREFLRKERNNIIHEYEWAAYEVWIDRDGDTLPNQMGLLSVKPQDAKSALIMRGGRYKDCNSIDLLKESAGWVEARICCAIGRAGFDPDENRNIVSFQKRPKRAPLKKGLLG